MSAEWFHAHWHTRWMFYHQRQHARMEIGAMIAAVALRHVHDRRLGFFRTVIAPIDVETRRVQVGIPRLAAHPPRRRRRNQAIERRDAKVVEGIQGASEHVVIALGGSDPRPTEALGRFRLKKARDQGELRIDKTSTM
jgi:hypothetical protein